MSISTVDFGIRLGDRYHIVRGYMKNPLYKPIIAPLVATFNQLYVAGLYAVLGYAYLTGEDEQILEQALAEDANKVLQYITLQRGEAMVKVHVDATNVARDSFSATVSIRDMADTALAIRTFGVSPLPEGAVPAFDTLWRDRLKASKDRIVHGLQNTDFEIVKQLAMEGWRYKFGQYLPAIYQIKHRIGLGAVPASTIQSRAVSAVQSESYDKKVDESVAKWKEKARVVLAAVDASADTVAWIISQTFAVP
jgi:hypothetical protein